MESGAKHEEENQSEEQSDELENAYHELDLQNQELQNLINYLQTENLLYKRKYSELKQYLTKLDQLVEQNARVFQQLYDDSRCALQMGRLSILNSPSVQRKSPIRVRPNSPKPSTSKAITPPQPLVDDNTLRSNTRRRLHIEPISMQEIQEAVADDSTLEPEEDTVQEPPIVLRDGLSMIVEENSNLRQETTVSSSSSSMNSTLTNLSRTKELVVHVDRLSSDVISRHLRKKNKTRYFESDSDVTEDSFSTSSSSGPSFASTPLKLETMRSLGLVPTTECASNFVNHRKRGGSSRVVSPKKEKLEQKRLTVQQKTPSPTADKSLPQARKRSQSSYKTPLFVNKRRRVSPEVENETVMNSPENKENIRSSPEAGPRSSISTETKPRKRKPKASSLVKRSSPRLRDSEKKTSPGVRQRPMRNGKPKTLKEPTLRSKLRRE